MPRRSRIIVPGIPLHIIQRGNNRQSCFFSEEDYLFYLDWLEEYSKSTGCFVHAYTLMTNHLLLTPQKADSAGSLMKNLGQRYVQYINRTYKRSGTLWEGRFRSCIIQQEEYLFSCQRYIEMNPVRANMVKHPGEYHWSSYQSNAKVTKLIY
ncbi:MAG: transposase [Thermodesulfobacteriota bacterium]|nr:transposase [Thermodesulfobacteriota bacterium]